MDRLVTFPSLDIQWGNHDLLWLGAYYGSKVCLLTLLRIAARYNYLFELEKEYGLNLRLLASFAQKIYYKNSIFTPQNKEGLTSKEQEEMEKIHQAVTMIQFKLESQLIQRRPEFHLSSRDLLAKIDYQQKKIKLKGNIYMLEGTCFQTIDPLKPNELTVEEEQVIDSLMYSFQSSLRIKKHMEFLLANGSMYLTNCQYESFHGCIPVDENGEFLSFSLGDKSYSGKELMSFFEKQLRTSVKDLFL